MAIAVSISCDGCGATEEISAGIEDGVNVIDSETDGWTHDGEDFCADCSKG